MIGEGDKDDDAIDTKLAVIKSEEQILKKLKQTDQDVTDKNVQAQILKDIVQRDHDLS